MKQEKIFDANYFGYDINADAIKIAKNLKKISFFNKDFLSSKEFNKTDLILCADVFEHVDCDITFLKDILSRGKYFLFNVPLDISIRSLLNNNLISETFNNVGHIHFYNKQIILLLLKYCGYDVIDSLYAKNFLEHSKKKSFKKILFSIPMFILDKFNEDLAATIFGGYSLTVLCKNPNY
ncbi:class I SAM-dependent methyltransferase [Candidatus Pelagibacter sp.]|nr:class I SAM-dependent methyltransferase [Candidatus Pelagibacter sp.]